MAQTKNLHRLSPAESGALVLSDAARDLDGAQDAPSFLRALERNRQIWQALAETHYRGLDRRLTDYAVATTRTMGNAGLNDDRVNALIEINRQVSAHLAEGVDIEQIRERAYFIWENTGHPHGQNIDHWLLAEMEAQQSSP